MIIWHTKNNRFISMRWKNSISSKLSCFFCSGVAHFICTFILYSKFSFGEVYRWFNIRNSILGQHISGNLWRQCIKIVIFRDNLRKIVGRKNVGLLKIKSLFHFWKLKRKIIIKKKHILKIGR